MWKCGESNPGPKHIGPKLSTSVAMSGERMRLGHGRCRIGLLAWFRFRVASLRKLSYGIRPLVSPVGVRKGSLRYAYASAGCRSNALALDLVRAV